ncbi:unnamed protein product [Closterium sp. NIES-53]
MMFDSLLLPYLFPNLSSFATVEDLVSHLRASDSRYRAAVPAEFLDKNQPPMFITLYFIVTRLPDSLRSVRDNFLSLDPTSLTVDLLEQHLLAAETSAAAVGAARGTPRPPFFEECSPSPLAPSYASPATVDVSDTEDVGAASASAKQRRSNGKGGKGGGGGSGGSGGGSSGGSGGSGGGGGGSGGSGGGGGSGTGGGGTGARHGGSRGGQRQQQQRRSETPSPQQLRESFLRGASRGSCPYVIRTGDRASQTCGRSHTQHRCFSRLDDTSCVDFGDDVELPRWEDLLKSRIAIFDLDFDAILSCMYALSVSVEGDCYPCVPPDPGIAAAALGATAYGTLPGIAPAESLYTFTLDSGASHCFFRDSTTLTPLPAPVPVRLADPSGGPEVARSSTVLPCPAVPSGSLSGLHLPSFSTNLVSTAALQDAMVTTTTPGGSSLYTLATVPSQVAASAQVSAASGQVAASCSCHLLSHQTLLWHHRLGHPSLPRLRGMHSRLLVSGLPRSLPPLPPLPAPPCLPCVEGRQHAAPHSSSFPPTIAPLQTLHMDVWGPARVSGQRREPYFLLVVDDYTRYTTVFPLRSKGQVIDVLIPWIRTVCLQLRERFGQDLLVLRLHSDRGGEFSSNLLRDFCHGEGILQSFTLPDSPQQNGIAERRIGLVMEDLLVLRLHSDRGGEFSSNLLRDFCHGEGILQSFTLPDSPHKNGIAERRIGLVMEVACTSMVHAAAPHFLWPFAVRYTAHQLNLWPRVSLPETSPTLRWTGEVGDASVFRVWGSRAFVRDTSADKLSPRAIPCVFLGFVPDASGWQFCHPTSRRVFPSQDVTFDDSTPSRPRVLLPWGAEFEGAKTRGGEPAGVATGGGEHGGAEPEGVEPGGAASEGAESGGAEPQGFCFVWSGASGAGGAGAVGLGGTRVAAGAGVTGGTTTTGSRGARTRGTRAAGTGSVEGAGAGDITESGATGAGGAGAGGAGVGVPGAGGAGVEGLGVGAAGAGGAGVVAPGGAVRPRLYFVPLLQQVLGTPSSTDLTFPLLCPPPDQSLPALQLASPLPAPSRYTEQSGGLTERREPASRPVSPVRTARHVPRSRPPPVLGTHAMFLHPSFESAAASALVAELLDFVAACRLDYTTALVAESTFAGPPSVGDIPTLRSYAKAITGSYSSQWQAAMDAEMASWKSTGTYGEAAAGFSACLQGALRCSRLQSTLQRFGFGFQFSSPQPTPLSTSHSLSAPPSDESVEPSGPYPELVGCLMYLMTCTRPDLAYPLSILARYVAPSRHRKVHWDAAKRVLHYLWSTSRMGLVLGGWGPVVLTGHADASWVDDSATQWSSQGYTFSLGSGSVSWRSTRSSSVLGSNCEAENYAGAMAAQELWLLTYLLTYLGEQPRSPPVLYVDNKAMIALCQEHRLEHRTKHIALRYFLARELQQRGQLRLACVATRANTADIFTKALLPGEHQPCFAFLDWSCDHLFSPTLPMGVCHNIIAFTFV